MKKLVISIFMILILVMAGCGTQAPEANDTPAEETQAEKPIVIEKYNYMTAEEVKNNIESNAPMIMVDIQVEDEYAKHHIPGAIPTYAYPVSTKEEAAKLDVVMEQLTANEDPIVVICPGGKNGAKRSITYFANNGIPQERMFILEKGQSGWPYPELTESK